MCHRISSLRLISFLLLLALLAAGCSSVGMGYERYYQGEHKPLTDIALIITLTDSMVPHTSSWIDSIDGRQANKSVRLGITFPSVRELNPGKHTICTKYQNVRMVGNTMIGNKSNGCRNISLDAKSGHVYLIYPKAKTHNNTWEPDYWDITGELRAPEMKDLVSDIDKAIAKYRMDKPPVSVSSLATKQSISHLAGFGEEHKSNLNKWLNRNMAVRYKFYRYVPYMVVEADNGIEYHLEIDQKTGDIVNVFGKNVNVKRGFYPAFQPLNSKIAYSYKENMATMPVWEEQKDGSFMRVK